MGIAKPVLYFYTNMPTPYQLDFFGALKHYFNLTVVYFTDRESDRQWELASTGDGYSTIILKNGWLAGLVQKFKPSFHFAKGIKKNVADAQADFIIINGTYWSPNVIYSLKIAARKDIQIAFWSEPVFPVNSKLKKWVKSLLLGPVKKHADMLLAIGKKAEECYRWYGFSKPIHNIPYNIDTELFKEANLDPAILEDLRNTYKSTGELIFLSSGSLIHRKGMDLIINAFKVLDPGINARLLIIGDGQEKAALQELAEGNDRIHFLGFQDKHIIPYWFNLCEVFVFASRYDGWALVINEAMAAGKAIICANSVGAAYDSLVNGKNALIVESEDVAGFAMAMHELQINKALRDHLGKDAFITGEGISSESMAKKLYDIYQLGK